MGCRWMDGRLFGKGWEKWELSSKKKGRPAKSLPVSAPHHTQSCDQPKTQRVVHSH